MPFPQDVHILIVDDEPSLRELLTDLLETRHYHVTACEDGVRALASFKENIYQLVITDIGMPQMAGAQVAEEIKALRPETPVIAITGWGHQLADFKKKHFDAVISKPFNFNEIFTAIEKCLQR